MFRELADEAPVMIWRSGVDKLCDWFNKPWLAFVGRSLEQEAGNGWAENVHPDDLDTCVATYHAAFDAREHFSMTYRLRRADGAYRWLLDNGAPFFRSGAFAGYVGSCVDVTAHREALDLVTSALQQRDTLLSEVYHRVKNNLQQIEGLIALESAAVTDPAAREAFLALSSRVRAMGAVHHLLILSRNISQIDADDFLMGLCRNIAHASGADRREISVELTADNVTLGFERALTIGLLVNELVTNAVKHAFPEGCPGRINVSFRRAPTGGTLLQVSDDGVGALEGLNSDARPPSSGMRLVRGFVGQLKGKLSIEGSSGTVIHVALP